MSTQEWEAALRKLITQTQIGRIHWRGNGAMPEDATFFRCEIDSYRILLRDAGDSWTISFIFSNGTPIWRWPDSCLIEVLRRAIIKAGAPPECAGKFLEKFLKNFLD